MDFFISMFIVTVKLTRLPGEHFTISEPQITQIDVYKHHKIRRLTEF